MSMLCSAYQLTAEQARSAQQVPEAAGELLGYSAPPPKVGVLSKLFGKPSKEKPPTRNKLEPIGEDKRFELGQAWHILHFLFTGSAEEGSGPSAFIMSGGLEVGSDLGYGPARLFTPEQVHEIADFLATQSAQSLSAAYNSEDIEAAQVYWQASSDPTEKQLQIEDLSEVIQGLRAFLGQVLETKGFLLIDIY